MATTTTTPNRPATAAVPGAKPATPPTQIAASAAPPTAAPERAIAKSFAELDDLSRLDTDGDTAPAPAPAAAAPPNASTLPKTTPPAAAPTPAATPAKSGDGNASAAAAKPGDSGAAAPPTGELKPGEADPTAKFHLAHDLRRELRRVGELARRHEADVKQLREQAAKAAANAAPDPAARAAMDEAKALRERLAQREEEIRYLEYTRSDDYREKFEKPFQQAVTDAYTEVGEMWVTGADGGQRLATQQDFDRVLEAPNQDVRRVARELFGDDAQDVLAMRRRISDLKRGAQQEAKRYREEGAKRDQRQLTETAEQRMSMERHWKHANETITGKYPEYFAPEEGDDEGNSILQRGLETVDAANSPSLSMEDRIAAQAGLRHRAAAFPREVHRRRRAEARVKELEEALAAYEASAPGEGKTETAAGTAAEAGMPAGYEKPASALDKLAASDPD